MNLPWWNKKQKKLETETSDILSQASAIAARAEKKCGQEDCEDDGFYGLQVIVGKGSVADQEGVVVEAGFSCLEHLPFLFEHLNEREHPYMVLVLPVKYGRVTPESLDVRPLEP